MRQGGVLSTFLYLVYINDLIVKIEQSSLHTGILNILSNCPSLADDLSCIGLTPLSLQNMLNIALVYSRKWRFKFNAQKSCILKFRAKGNRADQDYEWTLGDDVVPCLDVCNHLGILIITSVPSQTGLRPHVVRGGTRTLLLRT